jgi:aquaglyceroporin related protein
VLGAFCAAGVVYGRPSKYDFTAAKSHVFLANYKSAIDVYEGGSHIRTVPGYSNHSTAGIFCTYPAAFMTRTGMFFSEFIASAILMFCEFSPLEGSRVHYNADIMN